MQIADSLSTSYVWFHIFIWSRTFVLKPLKAGIGTRLTTQSPSENDRSRRFYLGNLCHKSPFHGIIYIRLSLVLNNYYVKKLEWNPLYGSVLAITAITLISIGLVAVGLHAVAENR